MLPKRDLIEIVGLYRKEGRVVPYYRAGKLNYEKLQPLKEAIERGDLEIFIFRNTYKRHESEPDMRLCITVPAEGTRR